MIRTSPRMSTVLLTGGSGFFGGVLKNRLLANGLSCVNVDLQRDDVVHDRLVSVQADICDRVAMAPLFARYRFDCVFHCAAILAHDVKDRGVLWASNVVGTEVIADLCDEHGVGKVVFTSSNCLWAEPFNRPVTEDDEPRPREVYGESKWAAEQVLLKPGRRFHAVIIRTPTIVDAGRLGLLAILFEFIDEGRRVWVVGGGKNRYQFIYAEDLADACIKAMSYPGRGIFNIGSDEVAPLREVYQRVIDRAGTGARIASLPRLPTLAAMRLAHALGVSPLGPYQYRMIAEDFVFDTTKIKRELSWTPTLTNGEMLSRAFEYYRANRGEIHNRTDASAHRRPARMGVIRLLKWVS
ncbi:MAG TPA: NAD(P)-dependent oxidoreductase [Vicinamibacterales bacterium]|nr:NAD(P)-dependent oxidoreductase [Vicinamibacterales bacterium]